MVPYLQLWCFIFAFYLLHTADLQVIQAMGRSDTILKIEVVKQVVSLLAIVVTIPFGVLAMMVSMCVVTVICLYINAKPNEELAGYGFREHIKDLMPITGLNILMGIAVWAAGKLLTGDIAVLTVQILVGAAVYIGGSYLLKLESFSYVLRTAAALKSKI